MSKDEKFIIFGAPCIGEDEIVEVVDSIRSGWLGTGPKVTRFEEAFAEKKGQRSVAAVSSCTAALHLSLIVAGVKPGDEIITTPLTFCSTVNSIIHAGGTPVLVDVDADSMNIDPDLIEERITPRTKGILIVHFAGRPCEIDAIMAIAQKHDLFVVEDCAHAIEAEYKNQPVGTFGSFGCFSFYATKNITTVEGGMVLAKSMEDLAAIKVMALHGLSVDAWDRYSDHGYKHYYVESLGFKYNLTDINAAIGIHQLSRIDEYSKRRESLWNYYNDALKDQPITLPSDPEPHIKHAYHLYTILVDDIKSGISRDKFIVELFNNNIGSGVHYLSVPEHPYYRRTFGWKCEDYPIAMKIGRQTVSIPLSPGLSDSQAERIAGNIIEILQRARQ